MFLITLIIDKYGTDGVIKEIIGYTTSEPLAKKYCKEKTEKLKYNKDMVIKYYTYQEIFNVMDDSNIDNKEKKESQTRQRRQKGLGIREEIRFRKSK